MRFRPLVTILLVLELALPPMPALAATDQDGSTPRATRGSDVLGGQSGGGFNAMTNSSSGAAEVSFAIQVAPGTGGVQPSMALSYSSSSRENTWVGKGWSLELGSIQRSLKNGVPTYTDRDTFVLDGEELVPGSTPGRYHTRRESFARITRIMVSGSPVWKVEQPDGTVLRYGVTAGSRIQNASGVPFSWLLSDVSDSDGNAMVYTYRARGAGELHPYEIRYTLRRADEPEGSFSSLDDNPALDRIIRFDVQPRGDTRVNFAAGFERRLTGLLTGIDVVVPDAMGAQQALGGPEGRRVPGRQPDVRLRHSLEWPEWARRGQVRKPRGDRGRSGVRAERDRPGDVRAGLAPSARRRRGALRPHSQRVTRGGCSSLSIWVADSSSLSGSTRLISHAASMRSTEVTAQRPAADPCRTSRPFV